MLIQKSWTAANWREELEGQCWDGNWRMAHVGLAELCN